MKQRPLACMRGSRLPLAVLILCLIQPLMDVSSYWTGFAGVNNIITLVLRLCVLVAVVAAGFYLSHRKWVYYVTVGVLLLLTVGHCVVCAYYGYQDLLGDVTNLIRIYHMPLITLAFVTFIRHDERCLAAVKQGMLGGFALIVLVELIATLTHTDPHTYANKGIGVLGWFTLPSAQSAILSMVVPIAVICVTERKKYHPAFVAVIGVFGFGALYFFATSLSYAALLGCAFGLALSCLVIKKTRGEKTGRAAAVFAAFGVAALLLVGVSPMTANDIKAAENARLKQEDILALVQADREEALEAGLSGTELEVASLKSAYEKYLPGVTGRFGLERTAEYYGYTTDVVNLSNTRLQKQSYSLMLLQDQPLARLFGLELYDLTHADVTYDAENDFHGIYYLCGGAGLVLMLAFVGYFLFRVVRALVLDFKGVFTFSAAGFGIAMICGLAHAYFTAGVLRRPNSNFYLGVIFAVIYILSERTVRKTEENEK